MIPPVLGSHTVSDPHIHSFELQLGKGTAYLQTSPEFAMKKTLARDGEAIYSLGPAFRAGEQGGKHQSEFLMLEWYRPGFSLEQLENEITDLVKYLAVRFDIEFKRPKRCSYAELFDARFGCNPHSCSDADLKRLTKQDFPELSAHLSSSVSQRNDYLDALFSLGVEPELIEPTYVTEFPASQASLAKVSSDETPVALRTELYWQGVELANGYDELRNGAELRKRIESDNALRREYGYPEIQPDEELLAALSEMPECAGVALGVDRLLMLLLGETSLDAVLV